MPSGAEKNPGTTNAPTPGRAQSTTSTGPPSCPKNTPPARAPVARSLRFIWSLPCPDLNDGKIPQRQGSTAAVKPGLDITAAVIEEYEE